MPPPIALVELIRPAAQGVSRPYLGRGEDDALYYVKGRQTDRHSVWSEWICAHLARAFGLRLPLFSLVAVSEDLLAEAAAEMRNLGEGLAFGSQQQADVCWFEPGWVHRVPLQQQLDVLVFDWWVRNADRLNGNTNLLWDGELVVIDHNRAFEPDFDAAFFAAHHVFAGAIPLLHDLAVQADYTSRLATLLPIFDAACDNAPPEWRWANPEQDVPANFDPVHARALLARCLNPDFWRMV